MCPGKSTIRLRYPALLLLTGLLAGFSVNHRAQAHHTDSHFAESSKHRIVYQLNKADPVYLQHVLFSASELMRKYGDDIEIVIGAVGPGLHLVGKQPGQPIPAELQQRAASLAEYGVAFHACGNTMKSLGWNKEDLLPFAEIVPIGIDDIMQLQEQGFTYISW